MDYKQLKIVKYMNKTNEEEYEKRINSYGVIKTDMYPYLMKRDSVKADYPLFVVPLQKLQILMQQIQEKSNIIKDLANTLPNVAKDQFYKEQLYKAVINNNEIEGVKTTKKEVSEAFNALTDKKNKRKRLLSTVRLYHDILSNDFLKIEDVKVIREIYDILTEGEIESNDALDGDLFRNDIVEVVDQNSGRTEHIPPKNETKILMMLTSWITFINDKTAPFLIKAALAHYFFENIHPFYDGNGRTGRYILSRYLSRKLDIYSGLVISQKINENKKKYYDAFRTTGDYENKAEGTFFVIDILELLKEGQNDIIKFLNEKQAPLGAFWDKIQHHPNMTDLEREILFLLFQSTVFVDLPKDGIKDNEIVTILSASYPKKTIKDNIKLLRSQGIITQTTKAPSRHLLEISKLLND